MGKSVKNKIFQHLFVYFSVINMIRMAFVRLFALLLLFSVVSCKKNRVCECTNSLGTYDAGEVEKTKSQAKKYCKDLSAGETTCKLKE